MHEVLGWVTTPETFTNRDVCDERTRMYSQRVSGVVTHPEAYLKNPQEFRALSKERLEMPCKPERLRAAHPCALSRSTVHPVHKRVSGGFTHPETFHKESSEIQTTDLTAFFHWATHFTAPKKNPPGITN
jgi:hypothetical protein